MGGHSETEEEFEDTFNGASFRCLLDTNMILLDTHHLPGNGVSVRV